MKNSKTKLEILKEKRDKIKNILNRPDPIQQSFYGGRVGFKNGTARKKWENSLDKELDLLNQLSVIEDKINNIECPLVRKKTIEIPTTTFSIGDKCFDLYHNKLTVVKINKKTVSVVNRFGDIENIKPHLLSR